MANEYPVIGNTRFLTRGARVWQAAYGCGTVIDLDASHVRIEFDDHVSRLFARSLVKLFPVRRGTAPSTKLTATVPPARRTLDFRSS